MHAPSTHKRISTIDAPAQQVPADFDGTFWNSDTIAELLRDIGLEHVAICPGSSFRGLHESLVNRLGNSRPEMLLCLHEEHAVAIAHGYARVTGKPMGVIVHCNVGLMHATMAVYNAWCDRMPVVILGGIGPVNSVRRRTPIDWLHSVADQGALVRNYVKWDDQPLSRQGRGGIDSARPPDGLHRAEGAGLHHARSTAAGRQLRLCATTSSRK